MLSSARFQSTVSPRGEHLHISVVPGVLAAERDILDHLALEAGGLVFPQDFNNQRVNSLQATTLRALHRD